MHARPFVRRRATFNYSAMAQKPKFAPAEVAQKIKDIGDPQKTVRELDFSFCGIMDDDAKCIGGALTTNGTLIGLKLDGNMIGNSGAYAIGDALKSNATLEHLSLAHLKIDWEGTVSIWQCLKVNARLLSIELQGNNLRNENNEKFCTALRFNKTLKYLGLSNTSLTNSTVLKLEESLHHNNVLENLDISYNSDVSSEAFDRLIEGIAANPSLSYINLSGNNLSKEAMEKFGTAENLKGLILQELLLSEFSGFVGLFNNLPPNLVSLDVSGNILPVELSKINIPLKSISFEGCSIGNEALSKFLLYLKTNTCLEMLNLSSNKFGTEVVEDLFTVLSTISSLKELKFTLNELPRLNPDNSTTLSKYISKAPNIQKIDLSYPKKIEAGFWKPFFNALQTNTTLTDLTLCNIDLQDSDTSELIKALQANSVIKRLCLTGNNKLSDASIEHLSGQYSLSFTLLELEIDLPPTLITTETENSSKILSKNYSLNHLTAFPACLLEMPFLTSVDLSSNTLSVLPPSLSELTNLTTLDISNNNLNALPLSLVGLAKLRNLKAAKNPFKTFPRDLRAKINENSRETCKLVLQYLRTLTTKADPLYRVKLMVLGSENSGKTTLISAMKKKLKVKRETSLSKDGIYIDEWLIECPIPIEKGGEKKTQNVVLNVWDVRTQCIPLEELYISERTIYLLCFNFEDQESEVQLDYLLQLTSPFYRNCPALIIGTHDDCFSYDIDSLSLKINAVNQRYSRKFNYEGIYLANESLESGDLVEKLNSMISGLPIFIQNTIWPRTFFEFEKFIRESNLEFEQSFLTRESNTTIDNIKSWSTLKEWATDCNLENEEIQNCISILHQWGVLSLFEDPKLKDYIVMDVNYISCFVVSLFATIKILAVRDGILTGRQLKELLTLNAISPEVQSFIIKLFLHYNIIYLIPPKRIRKCTRTLSEALEIDFYDLVFSQDELYIIPAILPNEPPKCHPILFPNHDDFKYQFCRHFVFDIIPRKFFEKLMVRIFDVAEEIFDYWKNSATASLKGDLIHIQFTPIDRKLAVTVRGELPPFQTFKNILNIVQLILHSNDDVVEVQEYAPCYDCHTEKFEIEKLEDTIINTPAVDGKWLIRCPRTSKMIDIDLLAPDVGFYNITCKKLKYEELEIYEEIGKGAFGTIYEGYFGDDVVAIKTLTPLTPGISLGFKEFRHEVSVMSSLKHSNLVNLFAISMDPFAIVMEFLPYGNLYEFVNNPASPKDWALALRIAIDVANGIYHMHTAHPPFIHRDLKSPNVLLCGFNPSEICAKIADFGTAVEMYLPSLRDKSSAFRDVANPTWLAPEIMSQEEYTEKSDIYSFGVILWEIVARQHPFQEFGFDFMFELEDAIKSNMRPTFPPHSPEEYNSLVNRCWQGDPNKRPSMFEALISLYELSSIAPELDFPEDILVDIYKKAVTHRTANLSPSQLKQKPFEAKGEFRQKSDAGSGIYCMTIVGDRQLWTGVKDGSIIVWNLFNGSEIARFPGVHKSYVWDLIKVGETIWTLGFDKSIKVWAVPSLETQKEELNNNLKILKSGNLNFMLTNPTGRKTKTKRRFVELYQSGTLYIKKTPQDRSPLHVVYLEDSRVYLKKKSNAPKVKFHIALLSGSIMTMSHSNVAESQSWLDLLIKHKSELEYPYIQLKLLHEILIDVTSIQFITRKPAPKKSRPVSGEPSQQHIHRSLSPRPPKSPRRKNTSTDVVWGACEDLKFKIWDPVTWETYNDLDLKEKFCELCTVTYPLSTNDFRVNKIVEHNNFIFLCITKWVACLDFNNNLIGLISGHNLKVSDICFDKDTIWTCSDDGTVRSWELQNGKFVSIKVITVKGKLFSLCKLDRFIWCAGWSGTISIWDIEKDYQPVLPKTDSKVHTDGIVAMRSWRNFVWAASWDGTISLWS